MVLQLQKLKRELGFNFGIKSSVLKSFTNSNNLKLVTASRSRISQNQLTSLVTEGTVYWLLVTISDIEKIIKQSSEKAFYSEYQIKRPLDLTTNDNNLTTLIVVRVAFAKIF